MNETSKATKRREKDSTFDWAAIFKGEGLDVGSGTDPLSPHVNCRASCSCRNFDLPDGGGDDITQFIEGPFDFVHGSQVLEHALDPVIMLRSWLHCLKPKGYIIATVPDWELYEKKVWPSQFNAGHQSAWTLNPTVDRIPFLIKLPEWLNQFPAEVKLCRLVTTNYDYSLPNVDQTFDANKGVECFIEFVLLKS